jgi:hypothetical protein
MDYSIRIPASPDRIKILEQACLEKKSLPKIKDYLYKPKGVDIKNFHPKEVCIRLREFISQKKPSTLTKIMTTKTKSGYFDQKENLGVGKTDYLITKARNLGLERWGEIHTTSTEYELKYVNVLLQKQLPIGLFIKIESGEKVGLQKALKLLSANENEKINKNAAELLAEYLEII